MQYHIVKGGFFVSDPKEENVRAILQAIDYGHLPPRETQRRLLNIIQAEATRTDAPTDETKIHTCMDLLERLQGEQEPIAPARVDALRQHIRKTKESVKNRRESLPQRLAVPRRLPLPLPYRIRCCGMKTGQPLMNSSTS